MNDAKNASNNLIICLIWGAIFSISFFLLADSIFSDYQLIRSRLDSIYGEHFVIGISYHKIIASLSIYALVAMIFVSAGEIKQIFRILVFMYSGNTDYSKKELRNCLISRTVFLGIYALLLTPIIDFYTKFFNNTGLIVHSCIAIYFSLAFLLDTVFNKLSISIKECWPK